MEAKKITSAKVRSNASQLRVTNKGELSPKSTQCSQTYFIKKLKSHLNLFLPLPFQHCP